MQLPIEMVVSFEFYKPRVSYNKLWDEVNICIYSTLGIGIIWIMTLLMVHSFPEFLPLNFCSSTDHKQLCNIISPCLSGETHVNCTQLDILHALRPYILSVLRLAYVLYAEPQLLEGKRRSGTRGRWRRRGWGWEWGWGSWRAESGIYSLSSCSSYIPQRQFRFQGFMSELLTRWGFNFVLGRSRVAVTWAKVVVFALMLLLLRVVPLSGSPRAPYPTLVGISPVRVLYSSRRRQSSLTTSVGNPWNESPEAPAQLLLPRRVAIVWRNFAATGTDGDVAMAMWRIQRSIDPVV